MLSCVTYFDAHCSLTHRFYVLRPEVEFLLFGVHRAETLLLREFLVLQPRLLAAQTFLHLSQTRLFVARSPESLLFPRRELLPLGLRLCFPRLQSLFSLQELFFKCTQVLLLAREVGLALFQGVLLFEEFFLQLLLCLHSLLQHLLLLRHLNALLLQLKSFVVDFQLRLLQRMRRAGTTKFRRRRRREGESPPKKAGTFGFQRLSCLT